MSTVWEGYCLVLWSWGESPFPGVWWEWDKVLCWPNDYMTGLGPALVVQGGHIPLARLEVLRGRLPLEKPVADLCSAPSFLTSLLT